MSDIYRRCGCRDENGKQWGILPQKPTALQLKRACPKLLADPKHGSWGFYLAAGIDPRTGKRRQIRQAGFTSKQAAQKARNATAAKLDRGSYVAPTKQTYGEYLQEWLPRHTSTGRGLKETTRFNYERYIRLDIVPSALGRMPLSAVRRFHIGGFIDDLMADGRGVATIRRIVAVVQASFKSAYMDQLVSDNPAVGVRQPRLVRSEPEVWSPAQVGVFLDVAAKHRLSALFEVAMFTGLRRGELLGLHWSDIDLTNRTITVRTNRTQVGAHVVESTPKTKAGARTIEIADATSGALIAWKLAQQAEQAAWGDCWNDQGYLFTHEDGRPLLPQYATRLFDKLRISAGLPKITFHGQRHEAISLMLNAGVSMAIASKRAGHSSIQVTADRYGHLLGSSSRDAAESAVALVPRKDTAHALHTQAQ